MDTNFSDLNPNVVPLTSDLNNAQDWALLQETNTDATNMEQQALNERMDQMNDMAYENGLLLSDQNYESPGDSTSGNGTPDDSSTGDGTPGDGMAGAWHSEGIAPHQTETMPDGREVIVYGSPTDYADFCHEQGKNDLGYSGDCGLCSAQDVLNQFGVPVTENDVVHHAVDNHLCDVDPNNPDNSGGTSADWECKVLTDYGVPAHVENDGNLEDLAKNIENGSGVIAEVNAGVLWNDPNSFEDGSANHAITVTGVVRDPESGQIQGFYVNDSGDGHAAKYVDAATMQSAWADAGGQSVVTDVTH